jgi:hypothetical protein
MMQTKTKKNIHKKMPRKIWSKKLRNCRKNKSIRSPNSNIWETLSINRYCCILGIYGATFPNQWSVAIDQFATNATKIVHNNHVVPQNSTTKRLIVLYSNTQKNDPYNHSKLYIINNLVLIELNGYRQV